MKVSVDKVRIGILLLIMAITVTMVLLTASRLPGGDVQTHTVVIQTHRGAQGAQATVPVQKTAASTGVDTTLSGDVVFPIGDLG